MSEQNQEHPTGYVAVRLGEDALSRLDALRSKLSASWPGATRSDVLRAVILHGLEVMETEPSAEPRLPADTTGE